MRFVAAIAVTALVMSGQGVVASAASAPVQPDPLLSWSEHPGQVDAGTLARTRAAKSRARILATAKPGRTYAEREPAWARGRNDVPASAEVTGFRSNPNASITGSLLADPTLAVLPEFAEPNDSAATASDTGVGAPARRAMRTTGRITGADQDFYRLHGRGHTRIATLTPGSDLDTVLTVFDAAGREVASADNVGATFDASLELDLTSGAEYFVRVTGGPGGASGTYELTIAAGEGSGDRDFYSVQLRAGDVLGASVTGSARKLVVHDTAGREVQGSRQDFSVVYPPNSPLPGGGNAAVDFVAPSSGRYHLGVEDGEGRYDLTVKALRPGVEAAGLQTVFVDFDGALVDTVPYGGEGVKSLSGMKNFLAAWGLGPSDEDAVITAAVDALRENLALGGKVRILNSRDHADPWGQRNVSRLVIGGTIAESGVATVAIAQSIDPGNFAHEETALVQLDLLSAPAGQPVSLNTYITPASDKTRFIGRALGNIAAHELGHMSGSWHQHQFNEHDTLMDQGGNPQAMFAIGADGVGGNADDIDMDFGEDVFVPNEGFTGVEDAANRTKWGYSRG
ncbi:hypothetical protein [Lentzea sp. NBRC 102530]|uniref:hypothetical protein n=1 Tax=Lentzea sp. NBRC 102530 TaxID=3032201 RepID=UPI0024A33C79|nr:hypothetical protein [Lentzea sp. NBRC 102530]GLY46691.1 hypothetical protein Lesp01_03470 [Lentzea sp. NBRC 102530]